MSTSTTTPAAAPATPAPYVRANHGSFTLERLYPHAPAKVFAAFENPAKMRRWFAEGEGFHVDTFEIDFKVGGRMTARFRFGGRPDAPIPDGAPMGNDAVYMDIIPGCRIVQAYAMTLNGKPFSASLVTFEFLPEGDGKSTRLVTTEQGTFFENSDGIQMREQGYRQLLEALARELERA
jgi:uncharacterized protein YndB with AHSA1/START domain